MLLKRFWGAEEVLEKSSCIVGLELAVDGDGLGIQDLGHKASVLAEAIPIRQRDECIPAKPNVLMSLGLAYKVPNVMTYIS